VLRRLRLLEGGVGVLVDGTGVRQRCPEDEPVERVGDVIVMGDGSRVAATRVTPPAELGLFGWRRKRPEPLRADHPRGFEPQARQMPCRRQRQQGWKRRVDVAFEVDLAGDVRARKAELAWSSDDPPEGVGRAHDEAGTRVL
jgi:hypothetical protein